MFDFIAQRKFLWVFRKFASDLTAGYFRKWNFTVQRAV
jgi:hypothetical protein